VQSGAGFDAQGVVRAELQPGEKLAWWAQPDERAFCHLVGPLRMFGQMFTGFAVVSLLFGVAVTQAVYWSGSGMPWYGMLAPLFCVPFIGAGLLLLRQPRRRARETVYGLTDRRAIVVASLYPIRKTVVRSYGPEQLGAIEIEVFEDGMGSVVFERAPDETIRGRTPTYAPRGFIGIADVRRVEGMVRRLAGSVKR
jgi:hypothetical protein